MKEVFLVHITLPESFSSEFYDLLAKQRELITELMEKRVVTSYSQDMDRRYLWIFVEAANYNEVMELISTFPIIHDVTSSIHELAFHDQAPVSLPDLIMN